MRGYALPLFVLCAFALALFKASGQEAGYGFRPAAAPASASAQPLQSGNSAGRFDTYFASNKPHTSTHAASLVELKDGGIRAFWFSGSREGAADVTINSAIFDPVRNTWGDEQVVTGREDTQRGLHRYIAKVGNPVAARASDGTLWLFYVTVSLGGWAGSSISMMTSNNEGASWSNPRKLVASPFINISTLVKGAPFLYADGSMGLPVYHEFISKFAEILRLDRSGNVIGKQRLAAGGQGTLQPVMLVRSKNDALALTRYAGSDEDRRVTSIASSDGGKSWQPPEKTPMRNPDAALAALMLADGRMLAVLNDQEQGRDTLSLQLSDDAGRTWRELRRLEDMSALRNKPMNEQSCLSLVDSSLRQSDGRLARAGAQTVAEYVDSAKVRMRTENGCHFEFSYPYLIQARNGDIHLAYTWNRTLIKHAVFDPAWITIMAQASPNDESSAP